MVNRYKILTQCLSHKNKLLPTPMYTTKTTPCSFYLKKKKNLHVPILMVRHFLVKIVSL